MPYDLIAFSEATPGTGTVAIAAALNESLYRTSGDDILLNPEAPYLLGVFYTALTTPSRAILRQPKRIDIDISKGVLATGVEPARGFTDLMNHPLLLNSKDKLNAFSVNASDEVTTIACMVGSGKLSPIDHIDHIIRGTVDQALTAHSWTKGAVTWAESLEAGVYSIVGMRGASYKASTPNLVLGRLDIPGAQDWKPGVPFGECGGDKTIPDNGLQESWAIWGNMKEITFDTKVGYPNVELLGTAANTDHIVELALQRVK